MQDPGYRAQAVVTRGYLSGLWAEATARPGAHGTDVKLQRARR